MARRDVFLITLIFLIFFVISLLTNVMGAIIPEIITSFEVSYKMAALLPFAFFLAYGLLSIPGGILVELWQEKRVVLLSFLLGLGGALLFALVPRYGVSLPSLFLIGAGMAIIQVAINPLLRVAGGEEHFAFNSVIGQLVFGAGGFVSPQIYKYVAEPTAARDPLQTLLSSLVPDSLPWVSVYWVFAASCAVMMAVVLVSRFPKVELKDDEKVGALSTHLGLLRRPMVWAYFVGIFCYVGSEQGAANWTSQFLSTYHGLDPQTDGANAVSAFWALMSAGCLLGLAALKVFDSRKVLVGFSVAAILSLTVGLAGPVDIARWALPMVGFFASVMWSVIISLALNSVREHHGSLAGILCTAILGGAIIPVIIGAISDQFGSLRMGMSFLYLTFGYVLLIGFWAKPLVNNETLSSRKAKDAAVLQA
ncbi:MAG: MFS transporter [Bryobacterales bacterium]|jgi:fucose permease|nr:MFS transporter [Bryobacterales bacterium]